MASSSRQRRPPLGERSLAGQLTLEGPGLHDRGPPMHLGWDLFDEAGTRWGRQEPKRFERAVGSGAARRPTATDVVASPARGDACTTKHWWVGTVTHPPLLRGRTMGCRTVPGSREMFVLVGAALADLLLIQAAASSSSAHHRRTLRDPEPPTVWLPQGATRQVAMCPSARSRTCGGTRAALSMGRYCLPFTAPTSTPNVCPTRVSCWAEHGSADSVLITTSRSFLAPCRATRGDACCSSARNARRAHRRYAPPEGRLPRVVRCESRRRGTGSETSTGAADRPRGPDSEEVMPCERCCPD